MAEEVVEETPKKKKPFTGIEKKARFETQPILGRDIEFRIKYSVREKAYLGRQLNKLNDYEITAKISDAKIEEYTKVVSEIAGLIVRSEEDAEFISDAVLDKDPNSDKFIGDDDFLDLIEYVMSRNDDESEEDSGKAKSGSKNS